MASWYDYGEWTEEEETAMDEEVAAATSTTTTTTIIPTPRPFSPVPWRPTPAPRWTTTTRLSPTTVSALTTPSPLPDVTAPEQEWEPVRVNLIRWCKLAVRAEA